MKSCLHCRNRDLAVKGVRYGDQDGIDSTRPKKLAPVGKAGNTVCLHGTPKLFFIAVANSRKSCAADFFLKQIAHVHTADIANTHNAKTHLSHGLTSLYHLFHYTTDSVQSKVLLLEKELQIPIINGILK